MWSKQHEIIADWLGNRIAKELEMFLKIGNAWGEDKLKLKERAIFKEHFPNDLESFSGPSIVFLLATIFVVAKDQPDDGFKNEAMTGSRMLL